MLQVSPRSLRDVAGLFDRLADRVAALPVFDVDSVGRQLAGSGIGDALCAAGTAHSYAREVVGQRLTTIAVLLRSCAEGYDGTDATSAARLAEVVEGCRQGEFPDFSDWSGAGQSDSGGTPGEHVVRVV